ncbi:MAG: hypothetical protein ACRCYU_01145 [Nocardioides sp.]
MGGLRQMGNTESPRSTEPRSRHRLTRPGSTPGSTQRTGLELLRVRELARDAVFVMGFSVSVSVLLVLSLFAFTSLLR